MSVSYTEKMENVLFEQWNEFDDYNEDYSALIDMLNSDAIFRSFGEGLLVFLQKRNPDLTMDTAIKYIEEICAQNGVAKSDIASTNTLKNWFKGGPRPKKGEDSRASMFALAFALQLTPNETAELFHKVYLDRAFDYRQTSEIIYYFCLNTKRTWQDAKRLISMVQPHDKDSSDVTMYTAQIKTDLDEIADETALLSYIGTHGHNLVQKSRSAKNTLENLLADANVFAKQEAEFVEYADRFRGSNRNSNNFTYEVITNLSVTGNSGTKTLFKNARLPKEIKTRFPEAVTLSKVDPTYEELRKVVILLSSYCFWFELQQKNVTLELDDYIEQINAYLDECGFALMYYGNPYDWMFMCCALFERPLDTFRGLLAEVLDEE